MAKKTPRGIRFCWVCSKKLYGNHHATVKGPDGNERVMHKYCAKHEYKPGDIKP
jgi:hypothetical protein